MFNLTCSQLLDEESKLILQRLDILEALEIGQLAATFGVDNRLPIAVEIRISDWIIYHASLPGGTSENQRWLDRKARVVKLKQHSTLFERVSAQERGVDWYKENNLLDETHAIHGGGLPLFTKTEGFVGALLVSGLPHLDDHQFGVKVLTEYLARKGQSL